MKASKEVDSSVLQCCAEKVKMGGSWNVIVKPMLQNVYK
jgi:hypothetical protein